MSERRTFCPEDGHPCYTPAGDEPEGFQCANYGLCRSFKLGGRVLGYAARSQKGEIIPVILAEQWKGEPDAQAG